MRRTFRMQNLAGKNITMFWKADCFGSDCRGKKNPNAIILIRQGSRHEEKTRTTGARGEEEEAAHQHKQAPQFF